MWQYGEARSDGEGRCRSGSMGRRDQTVKEGAEVTVWEREIRWRREIKPEQ
jgi:hypothetical protein